MKEPVLKTGDSQESVGSNPTLSANSFFVFGVYNRIVKFTLNSMEKYSSWPKRRPC